MLVRTRRGCRGLLASAARPLALLSLGGVAVAQTAQTKLPEVVVRGTKPKPAKPRAVAQRPQPTAPATPAEKLAAKSNAFDAARSNLYTTIGTTSDTISHDTIDALPQGSASPRSKRCCCRHPASRQDSAASGLIHVRNDHANVQFRINGVMLPDGVTGFGSVLETGLIGSMSLVTGALPAEFGLRTVGLIDITTRADAFNNSGSVSLYGGSHGDDHAELRIWRHVRRQLPDWRADRRQGGAVVHDHRLLCRGSNIFSPAAIGRPRWALNLRMPALQRHPRFLPTGEGLRLHVGLHLPSTRVSLIAGTSTSTFQISQCAR